MEGKKNILDSPLADAKKGIAMFGQAQLKVPEVSRDAFDSVAAAYAAWPMRPGELAVSRLTAGRSRVRSYSLNHTQAQLMAPA